MNSKVCIGIGIPAEWFDIIQPELAVVVVPSLVADILLPPSLAVLSLLSSPGFVLTLSLGSTSLQALATVSGARGRGAFHVPHHPAQARNLA